MLWRSQILVFGPGEGTGSHKILFELYPPAPDWYAQIKKQSSALGRVAALALMVLNSGEPSARLNPT